MAWWLLYDEIMNTANSDWYKEELPFPPSYLATNDDNAAHHFVNANSPYNDGWTQEFHKEELKKCQI